MQRSQTAKLLAKAALVDNRTVDAMTVEAWHEAIGHLDYDDAMAALTEHRRTSTEYLQPAHITAGVKKIRAARVDRGTAAEGIPDADPDDIPAYLAALRENRLRVASGHDHRPRPIHQLVAATAQTTHIPREDH